MPTRLGQWLLALLLAGCATREPSRWSGEGGVPEGVHRVVIITLTNRPSLNFDAPMDKEEASTLGFTKEDLREVDPRGVAIVFVSIPIAMVIKKAYGQIAGVNPEETEAAISIFTNAFASVNVPQQVADGLKSAGERRFPAQWSVGALSTEQSDSLYIEIGVPTVALTGRGEAANSQLSVLISGHCAIRTNPAGPILYSKSWSQKSEGPRHRFLGWSANNGSLFTNAIQQTSIKLAETMARDIFAQAK